jgi:hypothetical protein
MATILLNLSIFKLKRKGDIAVAHRRRHNLSQFFNRRISIPNVSNITIVDFNFCHGAVAYILIKN